MSRESGTGQGSDRRRSGLGRGLGALLGRSAAESEHSTGAEALDEQEKQPRDGGVISIPIDDIEANPLQPRTSFDVGSLVELATSIREHGVIQPLVVQM